MSKMISVWVFVLIGFFTTKVAFAKSCEEKGLKTISCKSVKNSSKSSFCAKKGVSVSAAEKSKYCKVDKKDKKKDAKKDKKKAKKEKKAKLEKKKEKAKKEIKSVTKKKDKIKNKVKKKREATPVVPVTEDDSLDLKDVQEALPKKEIPEAPVVPEDPAEKTKIETPTTEATESLPEVETQIAPAVNQETFDVPADSPMDLPEGDDLPLDALEEVQ